MLKELFISGVRVKMLHELLLKEREPLHVREIVRRVGTEINAVRRELARLSKLGLLEAEAKGNRLYYRVNRDFALYPELMNLLAKDSGLGKALVEHRAKLGKVKLVLMAAALIKGRAASQNEIDLLVVGEEINLDLLQRLVAQAEKDLGHEINYTVLSAEEFAWRKERKDNFILMILTQGRVVLAGDEELCRI